MNRRRLLITLLMAVLVLAPTAGIVYLLGAPRLVEVSPAVGASAVPAGAPLRLTFSQPMQPDSVTERLSIRPEVPGAFTWEDSTLIFTPDQPWPSDATVSVRLAPGAVAAGLLPFTINDENAWSFKVGQPRLVYLFPSDNPANIYLYDPLSGQSRQLTDSPGGVLEFDASADGQTIYYSVNSAAGASSIYRISRVSAVGSTRESDASDQTEGAPTQTGDTPTDAPALQPERVVLCEQASCRYPRLSPQGDYLAYERTALPGGEEPTYPRVWLLPLDDPQAEPRLADEAGHQTLQPLWSPDGRLTYYDSSQTAFVILNLDSGQRQTFPNETGQPGAWDPQGRYYIVPEIKFLETGAESAQLDLEPLASSHLIRFDSQENTTRDLTPDEYLEDAAPAYSHDGETIAFARKYLSAERWTPGRQLWLMDADGASPRQLTSEPFYNHYDIAWSPDNRLLAFVRFNQTILTEPPALWVIDRAGVRPRPIIEGAYAPQWVP